MGRAGWGGQQVSQISSRLQPLGRSGLEQA